MLLAFDKHPGKYSGPMQHRKEGHGCAEAVEQEDIFFVMIVLFFVSMIVLCGRKWGTCMEERGASIEERWHAWKDMDRCGDRWKDGLGGSEEGKVVFLLILLCFSLVSLASSIVVSLLLLSEKRFFPAFVICPKYRFLPWHCFVSPSITRRRYSP